MSAAVGWAVDFDPALWLDVPDLDGDRDETERWVAQLVGAVIADFTLTFPIPEGYAQVLGGQLGLLADLAHRRRDLGQLLVFLPNPSVDPVPVWVDFRTPLEDDPDYLLELAGARGLPALEPPVVDHVTTEALGEGIRVLRYADSAELGVVGNLCYAWRCLDTDVFVFLQLAELDLLAAMLPDVDELTTRIRPVFG